jgi:NADH-quinone oxidoreductase subunit N
MASMCVGNIGALRQSSVRGMLGYSSIAHIGFLLIGIITHTSFGIYALFFYLIAYLMMNIAVFFIIYFFSLDKRDSFDSYKGLGIKFPLVSVCFSLVMIALIGLPPTIGFSAKFFIFSGLWNAYQAHSNSIFLITFIIGLLNIVVSLFYYLRIPYYLFFEREIIQDQKIHFSYWQKVVIFILSIALLILFFFAGELFKMVQTIHFNF